jgi:hypothetical protein
VLLLITPVILSLLCIVFGIFANFTILPFLEKSAGGFCLIGLWKPTLALALLILGLIIGFIVFKIMSAATRESAAFIGGENLPEPQEIGVADFYNSIKELGGLRYIYRLAEKKFFDIYEQLKNLVFLLIRFLRYLHNGVLSTYLVWCLLGMLGLFFVFFK